MKKILLDTNFLIDLARFKVDAEELSELLSEPYKVFVFSSTIAELKKIAERSGAAGKFAKIALEMVRLEGIETVEVKERNADKALLTLANEDTIIATDDAELRKKLKNSGIKTIYLRSKKHLAMS